MSWTGRWDLLTASGTSESPNASGDEVEHSDIVKGADVGSDYVHLDQDELDSVDPGRPGASRSRSGPARTAQGALR